MAAQKKYPDELRERAVKMLFEVRERDATGGKPRPSAKASNVEEAFGTRLRRTYSLNRPCKMPVRSAI
jgi:hypothetical protein